MFTKLSGKPPHTHRLELDGQGTGETVDTSYGVLHTHKVTDFVCCEPEIDKVEKHIHDIDAPEATLHMEGDVPVVEEVKKDSMAETIKVKVEVEVPKESDNPGHHAKTKANVAEKY